LLLQISFNPQTEYRLYNSRAVASLKKEDLERLALKIWQDDSEKHLINVILLTDIKELTIDEKKVFYAVSQCYIARQ